MFTRKSKNISSDSSGQQDLSNRKEALVLEDNRARSSLQRKKMTDSQVAQRVIQFKEPFDSRARKIWDAAIATLSNAISRDEHLAVDDETIAAFFENELNLDNPHDTEMNSAADLEQYSVISRETALDHYNEVLAYCKKHQDKDDDEVSDDGSGSSEKPKAKKGSGSEDGSDDDEEEGSSSVKDGSFQSDDEEASIDKDADLHFSSEDDEAPEGRESFDKVVAVVRRLDVLLNTYLKGGKGVDKFKAVVDTIVSNIEAHKAKSKTRKVFPEEFNPVRLRSLREFNAFARNVRIAKAGKKKNEAKPTSFNYRFHIWKGSRIKYIKFRGKQLKDAYGKKGRTWPQIAHSLHELAGTLGKALAKTATEGDAQNIGNRVLATAMLMILAGRGDEVKNTLVGVHKLNDSALKEFEATTTEFFALTAGVENIRLPFTQLDTVIHLSNIAAGAEFGSDDNRYDFLNVFSSARKDKGVHKHVFIRGRYKWKQDDKGKQQVVRELTRYRGFTKTKLKFSLASSNKRGQKKSGKSIGKSMYSHSAGHGKVDKFMKGDKTVTQALWNQVRPLKGKESRRTVHENRLKIMGPLRIYNLFANLIKKHEKVLAKFKADQIAQYIMEAYTAYLEGTRPSGDNPFHGDFITLASPDFESSVNNILGEETEEADEATTGALKVILGAKNTVNLAELYTADPGKFKRAVAHIIHTNKPAATLILYMAIHTQNLALVQSVVAAGADVHAEDNKGKTALAYAIELKSAKIIQWLSEIGDKQVEGAALPKEWSEFSSKKIKRGGNWLDDQEVRGRLLARNLANTHVVPAVNIAQNPQLLATFIRDNYLAQMGGGNVAANTVVPINFNNAHWATLVIRQNPAQRSRPHVYFFDSMGSTQRKITLIRNMLRATGVYTRADNIHDLSDELQEDGYTCGTWLIESASAIVNALEAGRDVQYMEGRLEALQEGIGDLHTEHMTISRRKKVKVKKGAAKKQRTSGASTSSTPAPSKPAPKKDEEMEDSD